MDNMTDIELNYQVELLEDFFNGDLNLETLNEGIFDWFDNVKQHFKNKYMIKFIKQSNDMLEKSKEMKGALKDSSLANKKIEFTFKGYTYTMMDKTPQLVKAVIKGKIKSKDEVLKTFEKAKVEEQTFEKPVKWGLDMALKNVAIQRKVIPLINKTINEIDQAIRDAKSSKDKARVKEEKQKLSNLINGVEFILDYIMYISMAFARVVAPHVNVTT